MQVGEEVDPDVERLGESPVALAQPHVLLPSLRSPLHGDVTSCVSLQPEWKESVRVLSGGPGVCCMCCLKVAFSSF